MTMADNNPDSMADDIDPLVSREYRKLASETVPGDLNQAVLNTARKAVGRRSSSGWHTTWFRPIATGAVIALSLGLILEMNDSANPDTPVPDTGTAQPVDNATDAFREAVDDAAEQIREAEATVNRTTQNAAPDASQAMESGADADRATLLPVDRGCDEEQRSTMAGWWNCVVSLEDRGAHGLAEQELAALLRTYPAFVEPGQ